jgi:hypothetical protein
MSHKAINSALEIIKEGGLNRRSMLLLLDLETLKEAEPDDNRNLIDLDSDNLDKAKAREVGQAIKYIKRLGYTHFTKETIQYIKPNLKIVTISYVLDRLIVEGLLTLAVRGRNGNGRQNIYKMNF